MGLQDEEGTTTHRASPDEAAHNVQLPTSEELQLVVLVGQRRRKYVRS